MGIWKDRQHSTIKHLKNKHLTFIKKILNKYENIFTGGVSNSITSVPFKVRNLGLYVCHG